MNIQDVKKEARDMIEMRMAKEQWYIHEEVSKELADRIVELSAKAHEEATRCRTGAFCEFCDERKEKSKKFFEEK